MTRNDAEMKLVKKFWLEIIFGLAMVATVYLSAINALWPVGHIQIDYGKKLEQSDMRIEPAPMDYYLRQIQEIQNATTVIVVKDIQGYCLTEKIVEELENMGFNQSDTLLEKTYHSFIGILNNGEVVYQQIGGDEMIAFGGFIGNHYVYAISATYTKGNNGEVYVDDMPYAVNSRGFNIVTFNNEDRILYDSVAYDTHAENVPAYR